MNRRKFLYYFSTGTVLFATSSFLTNCRSDKLIFNIDEKEKIFIKKYNNSRIINLKNNYNSEVKKDLLNNKTIWIEKKLYTYAEVYNN